MEGVQSSKGFEKQAILGEILKILEDMTSDWEMGFAGKIGPETRLVADLAFESLDVVQLAVAIEEHFKSSGLPFQKLFMRRDGGYVDDVRVSEVVDFLFNHINNGGS
jgi:acyl carrier protein